MELKNQRCLVIGGSSGIGRAVAGLLHAEGAEVTLTGRTAASAEEAAKDIGPSVKPMALDLLQAHEIATLAGAVTTLDVLVITAGVTHFAPTEHDDPAAFDETIRTNLSGTYFALQALAPLLNDGARVVLTTTVLSRSYFYGATAMSASRAGLAVVLRTFANELVGRGIRVNAVAVGPIETPAWDKAGATEEDKAGVRSQVPLGRLGRAEEVAQAILFLATSRSSFVHGQELAVDGGWSAG
jgi:NAD(P)-dependent dehydrogenase (short-subunit alcohol dehydrogenase family)